MEHSTYEERLTEALTGHISMSRQDLLELLLDLATTAHDFKNLWLAARQLVLDEKLELS